MLPLALNTFTLSKLLITDGTYNSKRVGRD